MNIIQFLDEVGHSKLRFQYLHECIGGAKSIQRGKATEVRFGTTEMTPNDVLHPSRVAVIVWMDREDFERAQAEAGKVQARRGAAADAALAEIASLRAEVALLTDQNIRHRQDESQLKQQVQKLKEDGRDLIEHFDGLAEEEFGGTDEEKKMKARIDIFRALFDAN